MEHRRNNTLDILKLFASFMVVFIHVPFHGKIGVAVSALARFAVPLFFLISGYYSYNITPKKIKSRLFHILGLLVFAVVFSTTYTVLECLVLDGVQGVMGYFAAYKHPVRWLKLVLFNTPVHDPQLWYLFAMVYVYGIFYVLTRISAPEKLIFILSVLTLLANLVLGEILSAFHIATPVAFVRNFALTGFPFFGLGLLLRKYEDKIKNLSDLWIPVLAILGVAQTILFRYFIEKNELYSGSVLILFALVILFVKHPNGKYPSWLLACTGCSTYIYIFHLKITSFISKLYMALGIDYLSSVALRLLNPLLICVLSAGLAYIVVKLKERRRITL